MDQGVWKIVAHTLLMFLNSTLHINIKYFYTNHFNKCFTIYMFKILFKSEKLYSMYL
jgi:hypothetical protein